MSRTSGRSLPKMRELRREMDRSSTAMRFLAYERCYVKETNLMGNVFRGGEPCDTDFANFAANNVMKLCDALEAAEKLAEALNRALPVIRWMKTLGADSMGHSVANQVEPLLEDALAEWQAMKGRER